MDDIPEVLEPQNIPKKIELSEEEYADLAHRAEVSSQNFERAKKAEARAKELEDQSYVPSGNDEELNQVRSEVSEIKQRLQRAELIESNPELKEVWSDFEKFRQDPDNKGMNMKTAAKAFMVEKGLMSTPRKGLERSGGGDRAPIQTGMTREDVEKLRTNDYKKYKEMLMKDQIKITS